MSDWFTDNEAKIPRGGVRTRFAPSPTGYMHVGNLRTALYAYLIARRNGGTFILRIEDTDSAREVSGAVDLIYKTLAQCGLTHDEGPDVGGPAAPYIQSERRELYLPYAELLIARGAAYREGGAIRQRIPQGGSTTFTDAVFGKIITPNESLDDNVLLKSDGLPTYNFANVIDDHLMGITHVVRGSEYLSSTPKYNLLYDAFGWTPPEYIHCPPVMRDKQNKMSKRRGDPSFEDLIDLGYLTDAVVNYVALLGWSPGGEREIYSLKELCSAFEVGGISKSPAVFDTEKLKYFNSEYIRALSPADFSRLAEPYIRSVVTRETAPVAALAQLLQPRLSTLAEIPELLDFFEILPDYDASMYVHKKSKTDEAISLRVLQNALTAFSALTDWTRDALYDALIALAESMGAKNALVMYPVRIAVSGKSVTPGGAAEIAAILGRAETLRRIGLAIVKLEGSL
ncbi:MAG: glutamate--tRNA ligase [Oscillospiraceae bacterium]|jgi:glutamyl-tRNA synthetase|nr:glutamate--tRNA ligase [Oscillospiraceae bacterium]